MDTLKPDHKPHPELKPIPPKHDKPIHDLPPHIMDKFNIINERIAKLEGMVEVLLKVAKLG